MNDQRRGARHAQELGLAPVPKQKAFVWLNQKPDNTCGLGC